jgi:hypothetical protein
MAQGGKEKTGGGWRVMQGRPDVRELEINAIPDYLELISAIW